MAFYIKFAFIAFCFVVALLSYFICHSKRDWAWLVGGMGFTLGADYFLILHDSHLLGVFMFCFVHVCYMLRVLSERLKWWELLLLFLLGAGVIFAASFWLFVLVGLYGLLFGMDIVVNIWFYKYKDARLPKLNRGLVLAGLVLFMLCDINVLIFNLPRYFDLPVGLAQVFPLIWVFYLPSQGLLAVSGVKWKHVKG